MVTNIIPRKARKEIEKGLSRQAVVALMGPRQVGKTTLAFEIAQSHNGLYLDLENREDRHRLTQPVLFFESTEDRLVILDEIHRMPELFPILRGVMSMSLFSLERRPWTFETRNTPL